MSLPEFDILKDMSEQELNDLFEKEATDLINSAPSSMKGRLTAIYNGCCIKRQAGGSGVGNAIRAQKAMLDKFADLSETLQKSGFGEKP